MGISAYFCYQILPSSGEPSPLRESSTTMLGSGLVGILFETLILILIMLAPFIAFALIIHWLERVTQGRLVERFGWKSVLWTGWLGTPIHELSHAFMCWVFQHRVDEIALFEPDRDSGRLGYVRHSFQTGNWFQELGNLFIGIAPLAGGSIALAVLLWVFFPDAAHQAVELSKVESDNLGEKAVSVVLGMCQSVLSFSNIATLRFWAFIYLVLCIGSHMAPSPSDYHGASRGVYLFGAALVAGAFVLALLGIDAQEMGRGMIAVMGPLFAVLVLAILLCAIAAVVVHFLTMFFPQRYTVRD